MKRYGSIYIIKNKLNDKVYVGQTIFSVETRWKKHLNSYNPNTAIAKALNKYGAENFLFQEICSCFDKESLNEMEKYFISLYNSTSKNGYNMTYGGSSFIFTKEVKKKMSDAKMGNTIRKNSKANQNGSNKIKKLLHVQRLEGDTITTIEYNPSTSPRQLSKYEVMKDNIIEFYLMSNSSYKVANKFNLDKSMVCEYLRKWGILKSKSQSAKDRNKKRYEISKDLLNIVEKLFDKGLSTNRISKELQISRKTITRALEELKR